MKNNNENELAKVAIVGAAAASATPFKTAFKATLGFYLAQFLIGLAGLSIFAFIIFLITLFNK